MVYKNNTIRISDNAINNVLMYQNKYYIIDFLREKGEYVQGGNGAIFKIVDEEEKEYVIKLSKYPEKFRKNPKFRKRLLRFEREIEALYKARENNIQNIVRIEFHDILKIGNCDFQYYAMEKCDCTLAEYLRNPANELSISQRTSLCRKILLGIIGLSEFNIYHRDIKQDNIFFLDNEPYIGDLGLVDYKASEVIIDEKGELIGPTGWFSPEAINKYLVENTANVNQFDCTIDEKSEIFQLGKLFWFIYQGNIPVGQIKFTDFLPQDKMIFSLLFSMLRYSKIDRPDSNYILSQLNRYMEKH